MVRVWWVIFLLLPYAIAEQCINEKCYDCDGHLTEIDGSMKCITCNDDFIYKDGDCVSKYTISRNNPTIIDKFINKYFPEHPEIGFLMLVILAVAIVYIFMHRKELANLLKNG